MIKRDFKKCNDCSLLIEPNVTRKINLGSGCKCRHCGNSVSGVVQGYYSGDVFSVGHKQHEFTLVNEPKYCSKCKTKFKDVRYGCDNPINVTSEFQKISEPINAIGKPIEVELNK